MSAADSPGDGGSQPPSLEISHPRADNPAVPNWKLLAYNKRILKDWIELCRNTPQNAVRCYEWLQADAVKRINGRCYPLRGEQYAGCWAYEIGSGDRVYYKPNETARVATIYYAGAHPPKIPYPPSDM